MTTTPDPIALTDAEREAILAAVLACGRVLLPDAAAQKKGA